MSNIVKSRTSTVAFHRGKSGPTGRSILPPRGVVRYCKVQQLIASESPQLHSGAFKGRAFLVRFAKRRGGQCCVKDDKEWEYTHGGRVTPRVLYRTLSADSYRARSNSIVPHHFLVLVPLTTQPVGELGALVAPSSSQVGSSEPDQGWGRRICPPSSVHRNTGADGSGGGDERAVSPTALGRPSRAGITPWGTGVLLRRFAQRPKR